MKETEAQRGGESRFIFIAGCCRQPAHQHHTRRIPHTPFLRGNPSFLSLALCHSTGGCRERRVADVNSRDMGASPASIVYWKLCLGTINESRVHKTSSWQHVFMPAVFALLSVPSPSHQPASSCLSPPPSQLSFPARASLITSNCL